MMSGKRIVVVGGVAGGASFAARARRLMEDAEITVLERGPHVSFANCGLPYHIGGEIAKREQLIVKTPEALKKTLNVDAHTCTEVMSIDRENKKVSYRQVDTGKEGTLDYDYLLLSTGAAPLKPPIPGIDRAGLYTLRNVPDMDKIKGWIEGNDAKTAVVVGGGYIGLEMAEQLTKRGLKVTVAEALPQVMGPMDAEMAALVQKEMEQHGVEFVLGNPVSKFVDLADGEQGAAGAVVLKDGTRLPSDLVILGLGVRPDVKIARDAGIEVGQLGGIRVDDHLMTNDPAIYAVGDAVEVKDGVTRDWVVVPLAGPANRQGRIAADNVAGKKSVYKGTWGTAGIKLFSIVGAATGLNAKRLQRAGMKYEAVHLHALNHVGYYPGAKPIALKLIFNPETGEIYGAQAVGEKDVEKRIDVIATAIMGGMTVDDLAQLELVYAPPLGAAKDPVNLAGMAAENIRHGLVSVVQWHELGSLDFEKDFLLDVRNCDECAKGMIDGAVNIPLGELRGRLDEIPKDKRIVVHCMSGQRSYNATRVLLHHGFNAVNVSGSYKTWASMQ
jgi:NADPH-dependent 2,4-dienoyl-CoA reductase/sulfur reductase-like enzyme/rhodanese-related sulfurtransferase